MMVIKFQEMDAPTVLLTQDITAQELFAQNIVEIPLLMLVKESSVMMVTLLHLMVVQIV